MHSSINSKAKSHTSNHIDIIYVKLLNTVNAIKRDRGGRRAEDYAVSAANRDVFLR